MDPQRITKVGTLFLSIFVLLLKFDMVEAKNENIVQCYVCSWQKPSAKFNITDTCTHYNFKEEYSSIVNCTEGCEAITSRHSKNGDVIHFRRNCLNKRIGSKSEVRSGDQCYALEGRNEYLNICECHSNYCNSTKQKTFSIFCSIGTLFAMLIVRFVSSN